MNTYLLSATAITLSLALSEAAQADYPKTCSSIPSGRCEDEEEECTPDCCADDEDNPMPHLLRELRRLRTPERFPHLALLGIIANKVQMSGSRVLGDQATVLAGLAKIGPENWGRPVPVFDTLVNDVIAFSRAAKVLVTETDSAAVVHADEKVEGIFLKLVEELKERIANESQQPATVRS